MTSSWDEHWLSLAKLISERSKDPSTKCGAVIIGKNNDVVSTGYNGFARKVKDLPERYNDRRIKLLLTAHAEANSILFADRWRLNGASLYTTPFMPCSNCAVLVIQAGIKRVVAPEPTEDILSRWAESIRWSQIQFEEAGIELLLLKGA